MKRIYLDYNATTPLLAEVREAIEITQAATFGNASSLHAEGRAAQAKVDIARKQVAELVKADENEIFFTCSGSGADAMALRLLSLHNRQRNHLVVSAIEHQAVLSTCVELEDLGIQISRVLPDGEGVITPAAIAATLRPNTAAVVVMLANNDTGVIQPVKEIAALAHRHGARVHVDAVQAAGRVELDFRSLGADTMAISAHKFYGPKGVGALIMRQRALPASTDIHHEVRLPMQMPDDYHPGTTNVAGVVGLGVAAHIARQKLAQRAERGRKLRDMLETGLSVAVPAVTVNGKHADRLCNTLNVSFDQTDGVALAAALDERGIAISTGAACSGGGPSHVLRAMGVLPAKIMGSVRFSVGEFNSEEDINFTIKTTVDVLKELNG